MATCDFPLTPSSLAVVEKCAQDLCQVLLSKFQCSTAIEGARVDLPQKKFAASLPNGVVVSVWKADLAKFQADAVVNASNAKLQHCGGLALALARAGGPQVQRDSDEYIRRHGQLQAGDAVVTDAGLLSYKKIIHAVGPQLRSHPPLHEVKQAEVVLKKAIWKILDRVEEHHLQSVAIPAISSGIYCFPLRECAITIVSAVISYYTGAQRSSHVPNEVMLANIDEGTVAEMLRACQQLLPSNAPSSSSSSSSSLMASGSSATEASPATVRVERVSMNLIKGHLDRQKTDVLVNIISQKSKQGEPFIPRSFLQKVGDIVEKKFKQTYKEGRVTCTEPGLLLCRELFHVTWFKEESVEDLLSCMRDCLKMAVKKKHKSISIPVSSGEHQKMDEEAMARGLIQVATEFAKKSGATLEVHFVVYPSAVKIFQAIEKQMQGLHQTKVLPATEASGPRQRRASTPRILLTGESREATREAEHWLTRTLSSSSRDVTIYDNFLQLLGRDECRCLSNLTCRDLSVEELWEKGHSRVQLRGALAVAAGIKVEALLCKVLKVFVGEEEKELSQLSGQKVDFKRTVVDHNATIFSKKLSDFSSAGLLVVKMEEVKNSALNEMFHQKKMQLNVFTPRAMYQQLQAHLCNTVCHVGFHSVCTPPSEPALGEGIYFTGSLKEAMAVWKAPVQEYLYFAEAEVLTGKSTLGSPGLVLPPADPSNPQVRYHSVHGGDDIAVIFNGHQALPKYIYTCERYL